MALPIVTEAVGKWNSHRRQMAVHVPFADYLGGSQQRFTFSFFLSAKPLSTAWGGSQ
jgi:hypothetical protein